MSLENATKVSELVATNPPGTDPVSQGDNHIRMIKNVMQQNAIKSEIGQSATPANNFTIDASADNGTMKLARADGQDIMTVDAAGKVAFPQNPVQTWQNVTASRVIGTTYTNNTGQPITVYCNGSSGTANSAVMVTIDDTIEIRGNTQTGTAVRMSSSAVVPAGSDYKITNSNGAGGITVNDWLELR